MASKNSFIPLCLRFVLQIHSPRIYRILWRINEVQDLEVVKHHQKTHAAGDRPALT